MKNAITVIDQELIDWFDYWFCSDDELLIFEQLSIDEKTKSLLQMSKDLIEINAELTKREQKLKSFVDRISDNYIDTFSIDELTEVDCLLKGDSDANS